MESKSLLLSVIALQNNQKSKALAVLLSIPDARQKLEDYLGEDFQNFCKEYDSLPFDEQVRQFLYTQKLDHSNRYTNWMQLIQTQLVPYRKLNPVVQSSHLEGADPRNYSNISISVFGANEPVHTESFIEKHKLNPTCNYDRSNSNSNLNSSIISTTIYSQKPAKRSKSSNSLQSIIIETKQNEIERAKLNKQYNNIVKEISISEKALLQARQHFQDLFQQIRQIQQININLQNKKTVKNVNQTQEKGQIPSIQNKTVEVQKQIKQAIQALEQVVCMNPDFKMQIFGQTPQEKLENLYQQLIAATEENVFIASKEDQVVIYQEVLANDQMRQKLINQQCRLTKQISNLEGELQKLQNLIIQKDNDRKCYE